MLLWKVYGDGTEIDIVLARDANEAIEIVASLQGLDESSDIMPIHWYARAY